VDCKPAETLIGCAGWAIPPVARHEFASEGSSLRRYAAKFSAVEINSSFYRPHKPSTYARWAVTVPPTFKFAVKVPKAITHVRRLVDVEALLKEFLSQACCLGDKLGCLLVQLPPTLGYSVAAEVFFVVLRRHFAGVVVLEPRNHGWFTPSVESVLIANRISRAAADPGIQASACEPGGWTGLAYYRLHGSPRLYFSSYSLPYITSLAQKLNAHSNAGTVTWCTFDNTALGEATLNALSLQRLSCAGQGVVPPQM
jgi:uncharacterized protein YecE (DUF72 family)